MVLSSGSALMFLLLTAALIATAQAQPLAEQPSFGADASVGYGLSVISGDGLADRRHGSVLFRLDSFTHDRTYEGPRLGLGLWGQMTVKPTPSLETTGALGESAEEPLDLNHVGISAVLRHDPEAPISGTFGVGFGRLEMRVDERDPIALPAFTLEGGARTKLRDHVFLDLMLRTHWATRTDPLTAQQIDWWFIELAALIGSHVR